MSVPKRSLANEARERQHSTHTALHIVFCSTAWGVSFSDALGNVSSSNLRRVGSDGSTSLPQQLLQLRPRYPVFGGWRVAFDVGYSIPLLLPLSPPVGTSPAGTVTGAALADGTFEIVVEAPGLALPQVRQGMGIYLADRGCDRLSVTSQPSSSYSAAPDRLAHAQSNSS